MRKLTSNYPSRWLSEEVRRRFASPARSVTESKRALLLLAVLAVCALLSGCTDHIDLTGLPASCKDQTGKEVSVRVEIKIKQGVQLKAVDTMSVSSRGDAKFMIGADTQAKSMLKPGHSPATSEPNVIYTSDPVSIELKFKDPCKIDTKKTTIVLDDLPHHKTKGRVTYILKYDQFKP